MSWWGKLVGGAFGFMLGGPLGAILGAALGHNFDKGLDGLPDDDSLDPGEQERVQMVFFTATFSVMGAVAKADGHVTKEEIRLAEAVMREMGLNEDMMSTAKRLFNEGKQSDFPLQEVLEQFRFECHRRQTLIMMFIEIQLQAAYADGRLHTGEEALLKNVCEHLNISDFNYRQIEQRVRAERNYQRGNQSANNELTVKDAYAILGVDANTQDKDVKKAYRRLISQHHPDKLVAKGLPEEMMKVASQKTHEIKTAYEKIKQHRSMK